MRITLIQELRPFGFHWWSGSIEQFDTCRIYRVDQPPPGLAGGEIAIASGVASRRRPQPEANPGFRPTLGVLMEPVGTDDHGESGMVAWPVKLPGTNRGVSRRKISHRTSSTMNSLRVIVGLLVPFHEPAMRPACIKMTMRL